MVTTLLESGAKRKRSRGGLAASVAIHGVLIGLALSAGGHVAASTLEKPKAENIRFVPAPPPKPEPTKVYVAPKKEAPKPAAPKRAAAPRVQAPAPAPKQMAVAPAAPKIDLPANVPVITTPTVVPTSLPAIDPNALETVSEIVARASDVGGSSDASGAAGGSDRVTGEAGGDVGVSRGDGSAWSEAQVDKAVSALRVDPPRYPERLRASGVTGTVIVQFVVGPDGRVEDGSIKVLDSPHDQFTEAVKATLRRARYRPGEVRGTKVRQLVEQSFTFQLN